MTFIVWIIFGGVVGLVASMVMGGGNGLLVDIILGIVGAVLGGWIMSFFGKGGVSGFNIYSFLVALLGAVVLIAVARALRG